MLARNIHWLLVVGRDPDRRSLEREKQNQDPIISSFLRLRVGTLSFSN